MTLRGWFDFCALVVCGLHVEASQGLSEISDMSIAIQEVKHDKPAVRACSDADVDHERGNEGFRRLIAVLVELQYWWHYSIMVGRRAD